MSNYYPLGPQSVPVELTRPTPAYKQRAWLAVLSLLIFAALYFALAAWFIWTAYRMVGPIADGQGMLQHFLVGGGGAFLAIFMLKALFFVRRGGMADTLEIKAQQQPRLFEFINRLADDAGAPRAHRVFLSARVNAAVFYDFSILNLLFPSRKNLEIGLALVNVLTLSEMKAVLAHEFGHFAQRSMAIGTWVYIAQQIAAHVVARRDALDKFLRGLSRTDFRIAWVGWALSLIVWSIRSLLDSVFNLVVLAQRALSRQMEFQADLVAVSLTGSDELVHALHKLSAADDAWGRALDFAGSELRQNRLPQDLFLVQTRIIETTAKILNDKSYGKTPAVAAQNPELHRVFKTGFAQPPQMWSTHPASSDREANAKRRYLPAPHDDRSAWELFDDVEAVKAEVVAGLIGKTEATAVPLEQTVQALDERYSLLQYDPRYRGAYLGRALTRHVERPSDLYDQVLEKEDVRKALGELYTESLAVDLERLRDLSEERGMLQALRDKVYQATGGRIIYRGREISRRKLAAAIKEVAEDEERVRQSIIAHDRRCRSLHLQAAGQLGLGWKEYLAGLISMLHYAEHTLSNLRDAQGLLANIFAVVTADGKVSNNELKRLIGVANVLHTVLEGIHKDKAGVQIDSSLTARMGVSGWAEMLGEFKLPPASEGNINDWMNVIDGWVGSATGALSALYTATIEQLLLVEDQVARHLREQTAPEPAVQPSQTPESYSTLLLGQERKRQTRLDIWDRFQLADGLFPALARLLVAGAIVGSVLGFGSIAGTFSDLAIYNGLNVALTVKVGDKSLAMQPFTSRQVEIKLNEPLTIETTTRDGVPVESFVPPLEDRAQHYVYNVAGASPLVRWVAAYGNAAEVPPKFLGAPRWSAVSVDVYFAEPPQSVRIKSGGTTRSVLSGLDLEHSPAEWLGLLNEDTERARVIQAHAMWDQETAASTAEWKAIAAQFTEQ
jgi:Zn-dependent protease with chaperone function